MTEFKKVSQLITELQRLMDLHGDVMVETFFDGFDIGMEIHYEPERGAYEITPEGYEFDRTPKPATIYIGEKWYA
jgi:hypothetical protein